MNQHRIALALRHLADAIEEGATVEQAKPLPPSEIKEILTRDDAAELLQLHPKQITRFVKSRGLPGKKMGRGWRFRRSELMAWLDRQGRAAHS